MSESAEAHLARYCALFASLSSEDLPRLGEYFAADARFKDPFNDVRGVVAIRRVFTHMFDQVIEPRFVITRAIAEGDDDFLAWDFSFRMKRSPGRPEIIRGATHIQFASDGRVALHRDYWDAAEELYEKLPLLGGLMRFLKRQAAR